MCIRDSRSTYDKETFGFDYVPKSGKSEAVFRISEENGIVPVSYTHLRAHETVLDIVCRLLLEKKKRKTHTHMYV